MKTSSFFIGLLLAALCSAWTIIPTPALAFSRHPSASEKAFVGSEAWQKLDLRMRQAWEASQEKGGDRGRQLECMLKTTERISDDQRMLLEGAGFKPRSVVSRIVTGSLAAKDVPRVAELPFVQVMELAVPLLAK